MIQILNTGQIYFQYSDNALNTKTANENPPDIPVNLILTNSRGIMIKIEGKSIISKYYEARQLWIPAFN